MENRPPPSSESYLARAIILVGAAAWLIMLVTALAQRITFPSHQTKSRAQPTATVASPASHGSSTPGPTAAPNTPEPFPTSSIPTPDPKNIQAEISLLDTKVSSDGKSVQLSVSIMNTGESSFALSTQSVTLTAEDATVVKLLRSDPGLPQSFKPGETKTITLTFGKPSSPTATLTILDVQYDVEGY